jgi:hypothetical protein
MSLTLAWVVFPAVLLAVCVGCGLVVDRLSGRMVERCLLAPLGFAVVVVIGGACTMEPATARFATPAVVVTAIAGFALNRNRLGERAGPRLGAIAVLGVFAAYAAPVVASGHPTFAGYIKLDDSATWMALTDHFLEHGRDIAGVAPSTHSATLDYSLARGYPLGSLIPWGIARALVGQDLAWVLQPYLAVMASLLAMTGWSLLRPLIRSTAWRAAAIFIAAQPALLYGYALWGGVKELAASICVALSAALFPRLLDQRIRPQARAVPMVITMAATVIVLTLGGALWLMPVAAAALAVLLWTLSARAAAAAVGSACILGALLAAPALKTASFVLGSDAALTQQATSSGSQESLATALGNLGDPLSGAQVIGIWPAADFRTLPNARGFSYTLIALAIALAVAGIAHAFRRRSWGALLYIATAGLGCLVITRLGSPWLDGKALATASPMVLLAAAAGVGMLIERARWPAATLLGGAVAAGVLWSNVLAYGGVDLAPYVQLRELQHIGNRIAGHGPTLMTEYQTYGVRHFLRKADAEGASELRVRPVFLTRGGTLPKAAFADLDEIELSSLLEYRTLVIRRSPAASRPPAAFKLTQTGRWYDVWQRDPAAPQIVRHLGLGTPVNPAGRASCAEVRELAKAAGTQGRLAAVFRPPVVVADLNLLDHPPSWTDAAGADLLPGSRGSASGTIYIANPGTYAVWLGGSVRSRVEVRLDGRPTGSERAQLNVSGQWSDLGRADLEAGRHKLELRYRGPDLAPGSAGLAPPLGPLALSLVLGEPQISYVERANAASLCGKSLDWLEAVR